MTIMQPTYNINASPILKSSNKPIIIVTLSPTSIQGEKSYGDDKCGSRTLSNI